MCRPKGRETCTVELSPHKINFVDEGSAWNLDTGERIMFVEQRLGRTLEKLHLGGNFSSGALYALSCEDMCAVLKSKLGPTNDEVHRELRRHLDETLLEQSMTKAAVSEAVRRENVRGLTRFAVALVGGFVSLICLIMWQFALTVGVLVIVGMLLAALRKHSH